MTPPKPHVGMVLETGYPPDARVEREALALIEAGYKVSLLCQHHDKALPEQEVYKGIHITRVDPSLQYAVWGVPSTGLQVKTRLPHRGLVKSLIRRFQGVEPEWVGLIKEFIQDNRIDIVHVHDLKLLKSTMVAIKKQPKPLKILSDLHEDYPALVGRLTALRKGEAKGRQKQVWWERMEQQTLPHVDGVIVIVNEAKERLLRKYTGIDAASISILRNVVDVDTFLAAQHQATVDTTMCHDRFVLCYVGHVNSEHRGIHTVLKALPTLREMIPNILFLAAGTVQEAYFQRALAPIIQAHQLEPQVYFTGYCDETQFVPYIQQADVCVCPYQRNVITEHALPNKLFLYGLFKKPTLVSSCETLRNYVSETSCGLVFESENPDDLARAVKTLYDDKTKRDHCGEQGHYWVMHRDNWQAEKQQLISAYNRLSCV